MTHSQAHPLAGKTVTLNDSVVEDFMQHQVVSGAEYRIEDWWDRMTGGSWMNDDGNPAALQYGMRSLGGLPMDDEVVYGKIGNLGHIVHVSELGMGKENDKS